MLKVGRGHISDVGCRVAPINTWKFKIILSVRCKLKLDQELAWSRLSSMNPFFSFLAKDDIYP